MSDFPHKKRYEGVMFNVISVTRGWVGVQFAEKYRYVTLEWPLMAKTLAIFNKQESSLSNNGHRLVYNYYKFFNVVII